MTGYWLLLRQDDNGNVFVVAEYETEAAELRRIAGHLMQNESPARTIQTTALVHEAYLRLIDVTKVDWQHRAHFFAVSARVMRHILLDAARSRATAIAASRRRCSPARC